MERKKRYQNFCSCYRDTSHDVSCLQVKDSPGITESSLLLQRESAVGYLVKCEHIKLTTTTERGSGSGRSVSCEPNSTPYLVLSLTDPPVTAELD